MSSNTSSDILIAGAIAAFTVDLLVYPLDTIKTRIQSPNYAHFYTNAQTGKPNPALFRGVYQGIGSVIIATLPSSGAFFTTYERTKTLFTRLNTTSASPNGVLPIAAVHAGASSLAELVSCAILTPAEVIKQNAQMVSSGSPTNATLQTLAKFKSNPLALWRGYTALAGRNLPFTAMQFPMFERLKVLIREYRDRRGLSTGTIYESALITAFSAGSAGAVAAVITTPVDVVKTRIMLAAMDDAAHEGASPQAKVKPDGLVDAFGKSVESTKVSAKSAVRSLNPLATSEKRGRKSSWRIGQEIVAEKGVKGLWRGGALRGVWTFVGSGLYLGAYESGMVYLAARRGEHVNEADFL
ncbi:mitochondrial carrier protein-like protein [Cucurbitaria berberidis CBS 394.84]|uniref:Mitochondrial carrier protein-like protein n=1 Tax=Cucurbitaria berberidis CBS 394.84 TaxID=1168544 RepID=A0A9P4G8X9_9PLEO|nr:mitochondrial carrier protein-like protein [Cucurbitaria berberidis CBS 394.84]KAF1841061.1 mitochondrial carrier protein-like protein [Cucurbitaria berberidis CBS 394.84]